ncbi:hypothetical protein EDE11_10851 [Methylomonas methanica]|uniref:Uncharacterized protein n=1 Tax=Methylomonas methanica TaxID=421 RepID=A0ABY2CSA4_METMH|nr:hypothetical protein EDE11_10851 [Methylomonas methanica]
MVLYLTRVKRLDFYLVAVPDLGLRNSIDIRLSDFEAGDSFAGFAY